MFKGLIDYLKCVKENKATLAGYASFAGLAALPHIDMNLPNYVKDSAWCILLASTEINLILTGFGLSTFVAYKRTKRHLQRFDGIDERFFNKINDPKTYCVRRGYNLALREASLETLIKQADL